MMNKQAIFRYIIIIISTGLTLDSYAQQRGEVQDQEFVIRKDRVLTLPVQPRNFERIPVLSAPKSTTNFDYLVKPFFISLPPLEIATEASQKQFSKSKDVLFPGFVRLGFGNYTAPLVEARYNIWDTGDYVIGAKVKHEGFYTGPIGGKNSAETHSLVGLDATLYKEYFQLYGFVDYNRDLYNFYGYDPINLNLQEFNTSQNILNTFKIKAGISNLEKMSDLNYDVNFNVRFFEDSFKAKENELGINTKVDFRFDEKVRAEINADLSLTTPSDVFYSDTDRHYLRINPFVEYKNKGLRIKTGANIIFENDIIADKNSDFQVYPDIQASYMMDDAFGIYAGFEGDVLRKTYYDFVLENQFLGPSDRLLNTIQNFKAKVGLKGTVNGELTYEAGVNIGRYTNMHFFNSSPTDSLKFNIAYDSDTRLINYVAIVGWEYQDWYKLNASANYYQYTLNDLAAAFHRPKWELNLSNTFKPSEKLLLHANLNTMGGIVVLNPRLDATELLSPILDLHFKIDYKITDQFSVFAIGNNLLNQSNQRFLNYTVRGIQGIGGLTFKF